METCVLVIEGLSGGRNIVNLPKLYLGNQATAFNALYQGIIDSVPTTLVDFSEITLDGNSGQTKVSPRAVDVRPVRLNKLL
jgi:hypothetical protein